MATPRSKPQTIAFIPPGVEQSVGTRSLPLGRLAEATNVRQIKKGEWRKRPGFARTAPTTDTGSFIGPTVGSVYAGALVERDLGSQFWSYDSANNVRRYRGIFGTGTGVRPFPTYRDAGIVQSPATTTTGGALDDYGNRRSVLVLGANNDQWTITVGEGKFQYTVVGSDGSPKKAATDVTSANASQLTAVYHPGQSRIYVLVLNEAGTLVSSYSINATTYAFVGSAAYAAALVGATSLDAQYLTSPAEVAVVIASFATAVPRCRVTASYLDPATLAPKGAPAAVNLDLTPHANRPETCGGVNILISSGLTSWYYSFWRASATANTLELVLNTVTTATLASASTTVLTTIAVSAAEECRGVTSGWVDLSNGDRKVLAQPFRASTVTTRTFDQTVTLWTRSGATTSAVVARGAHLASKPCLLNSNWYWVSGRDDGYNLGSVVPTFEARPARRAELYLRDVSGNILCQLFEGGDGPAMWHRAISIDNESSGFFMYQQSQFVTTLVSPAAGQLALVAGRRGDAWFNPTPTVVTMDFNATYGPPVAALPNLAVFPGPITLACGPQDNLAELFPLHPPPTPWVTFGASGSSGVASVCATYRYVRADGRAWESAPTIPVVGTFFFNDNTVKIPTLRHVVGTNAQICLYSTVAGGSIFTLQDIRPNDPTVASVTMKIWPVSTTLVAPVALYTNGGGLSNATPPPCRALAIWRDRLHLAGTPTEGEVWSSQEIVEGFPPTFSEFLRSNWNDGQGAILGLKPVDHNYLAAFKRNGVAVASGPGPDGRGGNPYTWQTLTTEKGLSDTALASPVSTPWGCEFQNEADGRWCVVGTDLQVKDIMQGADDHRTKTVACALLVESERQVWVFCTDGTLLVRGYAFADQERPYGDWWRWTSAGLRRAYGAVITPTGPMHINVDGAIQSPGGTWVDTGDGGATSQVLMALETGRMAPFGFMQEGGVVGAHVLAQHISPTALRATITCDDNAASVHSIASTTAPDDYSYKPTGGFRCKEVRARVEENTASGNEGFVFVGWAFDVVPYGRTRILPVGQRIP